jgi:hypothetical protein
MGQPQLQTLLEELMPEEAAENVYFQPPENTVIQYPCIIYKRDSADTIFAGNRPYRIVKRYQVMVIAREPDSEIPDKIAALPMCTFDRFYTADKLNHDVFNLFF